MALIGSVNNQGSIQGQINSANGYLTGVISDASLLGGQVVGMRGLKGDKGDKGDTGNTGATGNGIASVVKTSSAGLVDTYTITYTNGNTATFTVTNGQDGTDGNDGHSPVVTASKVGKTTTISVDGTAIAYIIDGDDGNSPVITTSKVGKTTTILADGVSIGTVLDGDDGNSPVITTSKTGGTTTIYADGVSIGTVLDGDKGDEPVITASKTGKVTTVYADGTSIATINDGDDGHSPVVTASKVDKTTTIYVDGTAIATIDDGADGDVQDVTVNGTSVLNNHVAEVTVPTKTSDLNNDSLFPRGNKATFYGTCATAGATKTVTCADFTSADLTAGVTIVVSFSVANTGAVADLTLNVNSTGAYHIKYNSAGTIANLGDKSYLKASTYMFYFDGTNWILCGYDTNTNTIGYTVRTSGMNLPVKTACYRYRICFTSPDGNYYVPANASTSTSATASKTVTTEKIDPFGRIIYYSYSTAISANGTLGTSYQMEQYNGVTLGYSFNRTGVALTMTANKPVFVKCAPQTDGSAIIDADNPFVQTLPSTEDGKIYILLGYATAATTIEFVLQHPVYWYKDGCIRQWTNASFGSGSVTDVTQNGTSVLDGTVAKVVTHDVPSGGTSGQVLSKDSNDDYDLAWITVSGGGGDVVYATSSDTASTVAKTATIVSGTLSTLTSGVQAIVKFEETNTASSPTLNIGGTGAKSIKRYGSTAVGQNQNESWVAGSPVLFVYDGTNWVIAGWLNTTYSGGTSSGITTGTDNLNYIWSPKQIHDGIVGLATDVNVTQTNATPSSYTYWRPLIIGTSSNASEGFTPSTSTGTTYTFNTLEVQPSSGTIRMGKASMYNGSYTTKISPTTLTGNQTVIIPDKTGTMALTSDIPTVNDATLTIQKNSTNVATFTANASSNVTADISVPTDTGDLTNGAGFITSASLEVTVCSVIATGNIGANGYKASADYNVLNPPTGTGWTPIGVVGHRCTSAYINASNCRLSDDGTKLNAGFNNVGTSSHSADFYAYILWVKS